MNCHVQLGSPGSIIIFKYCHSYYQISLRYCLSNKNLNDKLIKIQCSLQDLGSSIATPTPLEETPSSDSVMKKVNKTRFDPDGTLTVELENWIDVFDVELPKLTMFILPSGGLAASHLHVSRAVCRRAERSIVSLGSQVEPTVSVYINRLSDFLFQAARYACLKEGNRSEEFYRK